MGRIITIVLIVAVVVLMIKRATRGKPVAGADLRVDAEPVTPLDEAGQRFFGRLQSAMPSTMIMVRPALGQLLAGRDDDSRQALARRFVDFAVCRRDSTPIGVVMIDETDASIESLVTRAGLRYAAFRSARLPSEREIRDALGFL